MIRKSRYIRTDTPTRHSMADIQSDWARKIYRKQIRDRKETHRSR